MSLATCGAVMAVMRAWRVDSGRAWVVVFACLAAACSKAPVPVSDGDNTNQNKHCIDLDEDGFGRGCAAGLDCNDRDPLRAVECGVPKQTCESGQTQSCFSLKAIEANVLHCSSGQRECDGGYFGVCQLGQTYTRQYDPSTGLIAGPVACNPCDPACALSTDFPDAADLGPDNSNGVVYDPGLGGITLPGGVGGGGLSDSDGDGVPDDYDAFPSDPTQDGYTENGDIFHLLPFGGPAVYDSLEIDTRLNTADVYFLMDTTESMQGEIDNLRATLTTGDYLVDPSECGIPGYIDFDWTGYYFNYEPDSTPDWNNLGKYGTHFTRMDDEINFNWGDGGFPSEGANSVNTINFGVRWTATANIPAGTYHISITSEDAAYVYIDGVRVLRVRHNVWSPTTDSIDMALGGSHTFRVDYENRHGVAMAKFSVGPTLSQIPDEYRGIIGSIQCSIADAGFGVGYFDDIPEPTYGDPSPACSDAATGTVHDLPYVNLLNISSAATIPDRALVTGAVDDLVAMCGFDDPESQLPALYAVATGQGLPDTRTGEVPAPVANYTFPKNAGETFGTAFNIGDISGNWKVVSGTTRGYDDDYGNLSTYGGSTGPDDSSADAVIRFTVTQPGEVVISSLYTCCNYNIAFWLADENQNFMYAINGGGYTASMFPYLEAGTYYLMIDGYNFWNEGEFVVGIGDWPHNWLTEPQTSCAAGEFGYPCFREGTIPIVILMTDAPMHGDENSYESYELTAPYYPDTIRALIRNGVKVIGIYSGWGAGGWENCTYPCLSGHDEEVCENQYVCTTRHQECGPRTYCEQGSCWTVNECWYVCDAYEQQLVCRDQFVCDTYSTTPTCTVRYSDTEDSLRQLALDTGTVDADGEPLVYGIDDDGTGMDQAVVSAVNTLANYSRMDVTLRVNDNVSTPTVDESQFVVSILTTSNNPRCQATHATWYEGCLPGTDVQFNVGFANNIVTPTAVPQVFDFRIDLLGDGVYVLSSTDVRIVVPPETATFPAEGSYWRDYDSTANCQGTERPDWGELSWTADFPAGTSIRWEAQTAEEESDLDSADIVSWTAPTASSPVNIGQMLESQGESNNLPYLRIKAVLQASADLSAAPVLNGFEMRYDCVNSL